MRIVKKPEWFQKNGEFNGIVGEWILDDGMSTLSHDKTPEGKDYYALSTQELRLTNKLQKLTFAEFVSYRLLNPEKIDD